MRDPVRLIALLLATLCWPTAPAAALNPDQLLDRAGPAVVTVRAFAGGASVGAGSGVVLPSGRIGAGCRQVDTAGAWRIGQDGHSTAAVLVAADRDGRLCLFAPADPIGTPSRPRLGRLRPNATVYVVGRPRGLEATATPGRVIRAGDGRTNPIQTTAAVSPGADGGGLFDDQGRLAGVASLERQDGHWLARPVAQLLALDSTPALGSAPAPAAGAEAGPDWPGRAMVLEQSGDREGLLAWCRRWTAAEASSADAWFALGTAYSLLGRSSAAIDSYRRTVRLDPRHLDAWFNLGLTYGRLGRHRDAIRALRRTLEIDLADVSLVLLGLAYLAAGNAGNPPGPWPPNWRGLTRNGPPICAARPAWTRRRPTAESQHPAKGSPAGPPRPWRRNTPCPSLPCCPLFSCCCAPMRPRSRPPKGRPRTASPPRPARWTSPSRSRHAHAHLQGHGPPRRPVRQGGRLRRPAAGGPGPAHPRPRGSPGPGGARPGAHANDIVLAGLRRPGAGRADPENGETRTVRGIIVTAVPAYNLVHHRDNGEPFHPRGAGNGYLLDFSDTRLYVAGDTENIPEMAALKTWTSPSCP